jgi:hypothetical protein
MQLEAYRLQASALAGSDQASEAERPFRMVLRLKPDFELPAQTKPKIMSVFRKVQAEEKELLRQSQALTRARVVQNMALVGEPPAKAYGGYPVRFDFRLKDPTGAVDSVVIPYRHVGQVPYSTVALARDEAGAWKGALAGDVTANEQGLLLEYYVETRDKNGALVTMGTEKDPLRLEVTPGMVIRERPPPLGKQWFFIGLGTTGVAGLATGLVALAERSAQGDYTRYAGGSGLLDAATLSQKASSTRSLARDTNILMGVTAGLTILTAITIPFTNWSDVPDLAEK